MPSRPSAAQAPRRSVPAFALYGEAAAPGADMLHLESIASRSQRYRWEIDAHLHQGLHQVLWLQSGSAQVWLDDAQQAVQSPAVIVIPPGVVHAFRFAPHAVGCVLTLSAGAVVQGDARAAAQALSTLFAAPRVLALQEDPELPRHAACSSNCWQTNSPRRGPLVPRCRCGWPAWWSGAWANGWPGN
jgi:AraC family transcriptional activator of pobA